MDHSKKIIVASLFIVIFVLVVTFSSWYVWNEIYFGDVCSCAVPLPILLPVVASIGLLTGTVTYYLFSPRFEKTLTNKEAVFKMLNSTEAKILKFIVDNNFEVSQAKIVQETGISKVNVFRCLEKLKRREIINKESVGKTNMVKLSDDIKAIFE